MRLGVEQALVDGRIANGAPLAGFNATTSEAGGGQLRGPICWPRGSNTKRKRSTPTAKAPSCD